MSKFHRWAEAIERVEMSNTTDRAVPVLPCACANLRRATRAVTRIYNQELQPTGLELTQFTLLMTLSITGEITQGQLGKILAMDTTTLTRMLGPLIKRGWMSVKAGRDRRQKLLQLTAAGREKFAQSRADWQRAQKVVRERLGEGIWNRMGALLTEITVAGGDE